MANEVAVAKRFSGDVADHTLRVMHDEGLYRHLLCRSGKSFMYWFEIITSPGQLTIRGDMGTYVFARLEDMFEFFGSKPRINAQYWGEKLLASSSPIQRYSPQAAKQHAVEALNDLIESRGLLSDEDEMDGVAKGSPAAIRQDFGDKVLALAEDEQEFRRALDSYASFDLRFEDTWEWDLREYDLRYLWNLHAIVWAISEYRGAKARESESADTPLFETK